MGSALFLTVQMSLSYSNVPFYAFITGKNQCQLKSKNLSRILEKNLKYSKSDDRIAGDDILFRRE